MSASMYSTGESWRALISADASAIVRKARSTVIRYGLDVMGRDRAPASDWYRAHGVSGRLYAWRGSPGNPAVDQCRPLRCMRFACPSAHARLGQVKAIAGGDWLSV